MSPHPPLLYNTQNNQLLLLYRGDSSQSCYYQGYRSTARHQNIDIIQIKQQDTQPKHECREIMSSRNFNVSKYFSIAGEPPLLRSQDTQSRPRPGH